MDADGKNDNWISPKETKYTVTRLVSGYQLMFTVGKSNHNSLLHDMRQAGSSGEVQT